MKPHRRLPLVLVAGLIGSLLGPGCGTPSTPSCTYAVSPTTVSLPEQGGTGTVSVAAGSGCQWTAASNAAWLAVTAGSAGTGNGSVTFTATANGTSPRSGTLTVASRTVTVSQSATPTFVLSGKVTDVFIGHGLQDVSVTVTNGPTSGSATTDLNGAYSIENLLAGTYTLDFTLASYAAASTTMAVPSAGTVQTTMTYLAPSRPSVDDLSGYWSGDGDYPNNPFQLLIMQVDGKFAGRYKDRHDLGWLEGTYASPEFNLWADFGDGKLLLQCTIISATGIDGVQRTSALGNTPHRFSMTR